MQFTKQQIANKITSAFHLYQKLKDKIYIYVFFNNEKKQYEEIQVYYGKENFMHLTGINYKDDNGKNLNGNDFYNFLESGGVLNSSSIKTKSETQLKLEIIHHLAELENCNSLKIVNQKLHMLNNSPHGAIRTKKMIFALGFEQIGLLKIPKTLLNLRTIKKIPTGYAVLCIYNPSIPKQGIGHQVVDKVAHFDDLFKKSPYQFK